MSYIWRRTVAAMCNVSFGVWREKISQHSMLRNTWTFCGGTSLVHVSFSLLTPSYYISVSNTNVMITNFHGNGASCTFGELSNRRFMRLLWACVILWSRSIQSTLHNEILTLTTRIANDMETQGIALVNHVHSRSIYNPPRGLTLASGRWWRYFEIT